MFQTSGNRMKLRKKVEKSTNYDAKKSSPELEVL